ncbi:hypothetical protein A9Q79_06430 [Methylophaga sp. 42_25_T18]|nr:hypothetical protein A9Q79_06430 [Methylophaga sp. 42_25_T18]OUR85965.1 hypothetical protein A9Q92_06850 [Methylophaga sp. 42_8_T64]
MKTKVIFSIMLMCLIGSAYSFDWESFPLPELTQNKSEHQQAFLKVRELIENAGYTEEEFKVNYTCTDKSCEINIYPKELDLEEEKYGLYFGCPLKWCATIIYSVSEQKIIKKEHWQ